MNAILGRIRRFFGKLPADNPPPGGYYADGEWRDPEPRRNYNVNPANPRLTAQEPT